MSHVEKRIVVHFSGFEPLDAAAHRKRYERCAERSAGVWNHAIETGPLEGDPRAPSFLVKASGPDWSTQTRIHLLDHHELIADLTSKPLIRRIFSGYRSAVRVLLEGGAWKYFRHAWRYGLFFVFPFLVVAIGLALALAIAASPLLFALSAWSLILTVPIACAFFVVLFMPAAERLHALHLFSHWELAVALADLRDDRANRRLQVCLSALRKAFSEPADEYVVTSHSMGSPIAVHVVGEVLRRDPDFFSSKVVFVTLGSGLLPCALLRSADLLRQRIGLLARCAHITWVDVQCLTDPIHFYKVSASAAAGHPDAPQPKMALIRVKHMLSGDRYRRIKNDFLRVHRQYVLAPDRRSEFDFTLMTAGPLPARDFAGFSQYRLPPLRKDGSLGIRAASAISDA